ncbi:hypothetical protein ACWDLG_39725 [Nonomuraea sp. NPDC003727]
MTQQPRGNSNKRREISAPVQAALWALSNGHCYAPGCPFPVIYEVRPGVFKKNAQIAHIYGVKPRANRYRECKNDAERRERDAFKNLILVCLAHHAEIDDSEYGEELYPPDLLLKWKREHEGEHGPALARLLPMTEERLGKLLSEFFTAPIARLEKIADQLERTGTLTADSLEDLRQVITMLQETPGGTDARTARTLAFAAEVFSSHDLRKSATSLGYAAERLPGVLRDLDRKINQLRSMT